MFSEKNCFVDGYKGTEKHAIFSIVARVMMPSSGDFLPKTRFFGQRWHKPA